MVCEQDLTLQQREAGILLCALAPSSRTEAEQCLRLAWFGEVMSLLRSYLNSLLPSPTGECELPTFQESELPVYKS